MAHNFKELKVWNDAMTLSKSIYIITHVFPSEEKFGMVTQMRRSVVSIPSNIAEGAGRTSNKEFAHFLYIAIGSSYELETQILLAIDFGYLNDMNTTEIINSISSIQKMLFGLKNKMILRN